MEENKVDITLDKEETDGKRLWTVRVDGKIVAKAKDVCWLCEKYRGCDYNGDGHCGVLS